MNWLCGGSEYLNPNLPNYLDTRSACGEGDSPQEPQRLSFHLGSHLPPGLGEMAQSKESADVIAGISFHWQVSKVWKVQRAEISILPWAGRKPIDAGEAGV